jgi:hypothetical protein
MLFAEIFGVSILFLSLGLISFSAFRRMSGVLQGFRSLVSVLNRGEENLVRMISW